MALTFGDAILYLRGDQSELDRDLKRAGKDAEGWAGSLGKRLSVPLNQGFTGLQNTLSSLAKKGAVVGLTAVAGGFAALSAGMVGAIALGSDAEEMMGKFNVVFANTGDRVAASLDSFAGAVGRSKFELRGMASTFGDTLKPMGFTEDAAADLSIQLSELAVDLGSFNNMETDEALRRLQGTLIGSHENALAFGVIINENTLKAELAAKGWDKLTGAELEQAKVQARINLLLKGTTDAQGDAERTAGGWANTMRRLQSMLADTGTEIGQKLLPVVTPLLQRFTDMAATNLPVVLDWIGSAIEKIGAFIAELTVELGAADTPLAAIIDSLDVFLPEETIARIWSFVDGVVGFKDSVMGVLQPVLEFIAANVELSDVWIAIGVVAASIVIPALAGIAAAVAPVIAVAAGLVAGVALLRKAWEADFLGMRTVLTNFWQDKAQPAFADMREWTAERLPGSLHTLQSAWEDHLLPAIRTVWSFLQANVIPLLASLANVALAAVRVQLAVLAAVWENVLRPALTAMWTFISDNIIPMFVRMDRSIGGIGSTIQGVIGWINRMAEMLNSAAERIPDLFKPGSPTPFEMGFRGIADAIEEVRNKSLNLTVGAGGLTAAGAGVGGGGGTVVINQSIGAGVDASAVRAAARDGYLDAKRARGG